MTDPAATTVTTTAVSGVATAAAAAEKVVETLAKVEGPILTGVSIFVPGAAAITVPLQTILPLIIPDIEQALNDIAQGPGSYMDIFSVLKTFADHIKRGMPNADALSPKASMTATSMAAPNVG
jgi:hypothetical protein